MKDFFSLFRPEQIKPLLFSPEFPWKIFYRIISMQFLLVLGVLSISIFLGRFFIQQQFKYQIETRLRDVLVLLSHHVSREIPSAWCEKESRDLAFQFSVLELSGRVLCKSEKKEIKEQKENTEEIFSLLQNAIHPQSFRVQVRDDFIYGVYFDSKNNLLIRGTAPLEQFTQTLAVLDTSLIVFLFLMTLLLISLTLWSAKQLVFPLGRLLIKTKNVLAEKQEFLTQKDLEEKGFDEWLELESNIDDLHRDLVEKKKSLSMEQVEIETIMSSISDAIVAIDPQGSFLFYNSRFALLFGKEGLKNRKPQLWGIFRDPEILSLFSQALSKGDSGEAKTIRFVMEDNTKKYFSLSVSPLRKVDQSVYGAVGIFHDISDLKSAEQMRIDFVANVSHELRTPLTVIQGFTDTLIQELGQEKKGTIFDFLQGIRRNSNRLLNLMNDLLNLSSIESTDILHKEILNTTEITERILTQFQTNFSTKSQQVETHFQSQRVYADQERLEQVMINLLDNANKYTQTGGKIQILWQLEPNEKETKLVISNNGPIIPREHHGRLFERFYRIDRARSREQGGTGLGLAIVKHIMQRHGGVVSIESPASDFSVSFICRFPLETSF